VDWHGRSVAPASVAWSPHSSLEAQVIYHRETVVDITSDYFPNNDAMYEYLGNNGIQAVVDAKYTSETREDFHPHGSITSTFTRLLSWQLLEIRLHGRMLVKDNTPADFPVAAIVELAASDAFRTELERGTR
jgi:hypothetical protein